MSLTRIPLALAVPYAILNGVLFVVALVDPAIEYSGPVVLQKPPQMLDSTVAMTRSLEPVAQRQFRRFIFEFEGAKGEPVSRMTSYVFAGVPSVMEP